VVATTILAEIGDFSRFSHPRQLVAYSGLAPGEHSRGITKAGSSIAQTVLCEASVELPCHSKDRRVDEEPLSTCVPGYLRARLESATTPAQDVSTSYSTGKTLGRGNGRGRLRIVRVRLVDRTARSTRRLSGAHRTICIIEDAGLGEGNPRIDFGHAATPTSAVRVRQPSDARSSWGTQPPRRSLSDRRERRASSPMRIVFADHRVCG
jgi:hypothetical protein